MIKDSIKKVKALYLLQRRRRDRKACMSIPNAKDSDQELMIVFW